MSDIKGGYAIKSYNSEDKGTIGVIYKRSSDYFLISAHHVLGPGGTEIKFGGVSIGEVFATLYNRKVDCSVSWLDASDKYKYLSGANTLFGSDFGDIISPIKDTKVKMFSRVRGTWVRGEIVCADLNISASGKPFMEKQLLIKPTMFDSFGSPGDSGSIVFVDDGEKNNILGLFVAVFKKGPPNKLNTLYGGDKLVVDDLKCGSDIIGDIDPQKLYGVANNFSIINMALGLDKSNFVFK